ncbi:unnamed protein product [Notodromas monacha]|uniref:C2H2-type domain-containing protein n=1 Tax=Notodromas monacha TaxID=399045 RepID=A0A7R9BE94_9CRUS|nr:unnamed protein product [Notodromas monacha]CAG0913782.1 unnamed protein product [Notodromas monacha]
MSLESGDFSDILPQTDTIFEYEKHVLICPAVEELKVIESSNQCPVSSCGVVIANRAALVHHMRQNHKIPLKTDADKFPKKERFYVCPDPECLYSVEKGKRFDKRKAVKQHFLKVHGEKVHSCKTCSKKFGLVHDLNAHKSECGFVYRCGSCPITYTKFVNLKGHSKLKNHYFDPNQDPKVRKSGKAVPVPILPPETAKVFIMVPVKLRPAVLDSATSPRRDPVGDDFSQQVCLGNLDKELKDSSPTKRDCVSIVPKPGDTGPINALFAAHALMDLAVSPFLRFPSRVEIGVQTDGDSSSKRRSSPARGSRKRCAEAQTRLTSRKKKKVSHSVAQTVLAELPRRSRKGLSPVHKNFKGSFDSPVVVPKFIDAEVSCSYPDSDDLPSGNSSFWENPPALEANSGSTNIQTQTEDDLDCLLDELEPADWEVLSASTQTFFEDWADFVKSAFESDRSIDLSVDSNLDVNNHEGTQENPEIHG